MKGPIRVLITDDHAIVRKGLTVLLATEAVVPGLTDASFQKHAEAAKKGCPVSKALAGPRITLAAKLLA